MGGLYQQQNHKHENIPTFVMGFSFKKHYGLSMGIYPFI